MGSYQIKLVHERSARKKPGTMNPEIRKKIEQVGNVLVNIEGTKNIDPSNPL